ncbi:protein takeout [Nilaparvata lugens]|uniref:protein takeout n=1 Tax=Nilaparvata lugens TaxID=108931 RepID=UPI00193E3A0D|nr:protein takeout [Nilaparvata lugens]
MGPNILNFLAASAFLLAVFSSFISIASSAKLQALPLPSYVGKGCSPNDPNLNECVVKTGAPAIKKIAQGDPKYRIPKLDPLTIPQIKIRQGTRQVGLSLELNNLKMYGLQDVDFRSARLDLNNSHCEWDFFLKKMTMIGKYNVSGQVLVLPITGQGDANVTVTGVTFTFIYDYILEKRANGLEYVKVTDYKMPFQVTDMKIKLDNLFNGDRLLGSNMNQFLNENWQEIMKELGPAMGEALGEIFKQTLTSMADVVPFKNIFPKD